jgi:hypothetical protein
MQGFLAVPIRRLPCHEPYMRLIQSTLRRGLLMAVALVWSGCYLGPPNLAAVVAERPADTVISPVAEAGFDFAQGYILEGTENSPTPIKMGYHSLNAEAGFVLVGDYVFVAPYYLDQTYFFPAVAGGVKYKRAYASLSINSIGNSGQDREPVDWGWQGGVRVDDRVTLVADGHQLVFHDYDSPPARFILVPGDHHRTWAYRLTASLLVKRMGANLNPSVFYVPEKKRIGFGAGISGLGF